MSKRGEGRYPRRPEAIILIVRKTREHLIDRRNVQGPTKHRAEILAHPRERLNVDASTRTERVTVSLVDAFELLGGTFNHVSTSLARSRSASETPNFVISGSDEELGGPSLFCGCPGHADEIPCLSGGGSVSSPSVSGQLPDKWQLSTSVITVSIPSVSGRLPDCILVDWLLESLR